MYLCRTCGQTGEVPVRVYEPDSSYAGKCGYCGSTLISDEKERCRVCGKPLFERDYAYEAGNMIFCADCTEKIAI